MCRVQNILVVSRMTQSCREAVDCALEIARKYGARLHVLHIVSEPVDLEALNAPEFIPDGRYKTYLSLQQEAREELERVLHREIEGGLDVKIIVGSDEALDDIVKTVQEEKIDLLVALAQEEGRLEHLLFGGENDALIRKMPCNILLVRKELESVSW